MPRRNILLSVLKGKIVNRNFVCQRILHDVCHIDIGSLVAITDFKEVLMPTLADIIAGDLVLPQGGQGAG